MFFYIYLVSRRGSDENASLPPTPSSAPAPAAIFSPPTHDRRNSPAAAAVPLFASALSVFVFDWYGCIFFFYLIYLNNTNEPFRSAIGNKSSPPKSPQCRCPAASRRPTWKAQAQPARPEEAHSCQRPVDRAPVQGPPLFAARANATMNRTRRRTMTTTTTMANTTNH